MGRWVFSGREFAYGGNGSWEQFGGQDIHNPHPDAIEFRPDGTFSSSWSEEEHTKLARLWPDSANPIEGVYSVERSLLGDWLSMRPGVRRRFKVSGDTLILRNLGDTWASEKYRWKS